MIFTTSVAQKGVRIAYIDFNEIIEEISDYREAIQSLESKACLLYTSPSPRDGLLSRMPSSA